MFTGVVEGLGRVAEIRRTRSGARVRFSVPFLKRRPRAGESISVSGVCLTVARPRAAGFEADLSSETLSVTTLGRLKKGDPVHIERALRVGDRVGGHLVLGHVDGAARVERARNGVLEVSVPPRLAKFLVARGCAALDGVSLTVARASGRRARFYVIPETYRRTRFGRLKRGDLLNLETDLALKFMSAFMKARRVRPARRGV